MPITVVIAHDMKADREPHLETGMNEHESKPLELQALVLVIDRQAPIVVVP